MNLADARTAPGDLGRTRYLLAYFNVQLGRYYEAAILANDVARNFTPVAPDEQDPEKNAAEVEAQRGIPLEAASTAVLAWTKAYQDRPAGTDGSFELARLNEIADFIARRFPESDRASSARLALGRLLLRDGNLPDAAAVFAAVPESDASYAEARLKAGDALWRLFLERSNAEPPAPRDELDDPENPRAVRVGDGRCRDEREAAGGRGGAGAVRRREGHAGPTAEPRRRVRRRPGRPRRRPAPRHRRRRGDRRRRRPAGPRP